MTLDADQWRRLCQRRDAGVVASATDPLANRLLTGTTPQERRALIDDGQHARREMIEENLGLVRFAVARYIPTAGLDRDDYFQEGVVGLAVAIDRYDPARSDHFSSFALPHIRGAVSTLVSTRGGDLREWQGRTALHVERERARLERLGRPAGTKDIAATLGVTERTVVAGLSYRRPTALTIPGSTHDLPDLAAPNPHDHARASPAMRTLFMLPSQERRALEAVHSDTNAGRTMADIASDLGLSRRQLRAVVDSGHRHLRALLEKADPDRAVRPRSAREREERLQLVQSNRLSPPPGR